MPYRLLALDLDGTTVADGRLPTVRVRAAVAAARDHGVHVILATGRPFQSASVFAEALGLRSPLVCYQGALVREVDRDQPALLRQTLPAAPFAGLLALAEDRGLEIALYSETKIYLARPSRGNTFYNRWLGLPVAGFADVAAAYAALQADAGLPFKGVCILDEAETAQLALELTGRFGSQLAIMRSHPNFVEAVPRMASKGRAVAFLAQRYGIPQAATLAVGDAGNDLSMISWAGLGVAMGNASPDLLAAADWIAPTVSEDGVAAVIERFILGQTAQAGGNGREREHASGE